MPKLAAKALSKNKAGIEAVAIGFFTKSGFHGVNVREIAEAANMSLGNLYIYYPDKISLFKEILKQQSEAFLNPYNEVVQYFLGNEFPNDLEQLAEAIMNNTDRFSDYFKLIYVDVVEFNGKHIRELFSDLEEKFTQATGKKFKSIEGLGRDGSVEPIFALTTVYMAFYQYFMLTKLFGAKNIYGSRTDKKVIKDMIHLFEMGIAPMEGK